jgi:hypothetical protein
MIDRLLNPVWKVFDRLLQFACGRTRGGHHYDAEILVSEDRTTYILDPVVECEHCGKSLPPKIYDLFVEQVRLMNVEQDAELW